MLVNRVTLLSYWACIKANVNYCAVESVSVAKGIYSFPKYNWNFVFYSFIDMLLTFVFISVSIYFQEETEESELEEAGNEYFVNLKLFPASFR